MRKLMKPSFQTLLTIALLGGCGKTTGKLGLVEGIGADHRCIPSKLAPFGKDLAPLSASQRKIVYEFVRDLTNLRGFGEKTFLLAGNPEFSLPTYPDLERLRSEVQAGHCEVKFADLKSGHDVITSVTGSQCPVSMAKFADNGRLLKEGSSYEQLNEELRINDPSYRNGRVVAKKSKHDFVLDQFKKSATPAMHVTTCRAGTGEVESLDHGIVKTYFTMESLFSWEDFNDPNGINEAHSRRGLQFQDFAVEFEWTLKGLGDQPNSVNRYTINGQPIEEGELEAAGISTNQIGHEGRGLLVED